MNNIEVGDKVTTPRGKQGEVVEIINRYDLIAALSDNPKIKVKIDGAKEEEFEKMELQIKEKKPNSKQAIDAINNIKQEINSNNFPDLQKRENGELTTHLGYTEEYINGKSKVSPIPDLKYVEERLKILNSAKFKEVIEPKLGTVQWWARYNK